MQSLIFSYPNYSSYADFQLQLNQFIVDNSIDQANFISQSTNMSLGVVVFYVKAG